jgi:flagellar biosynthesis protein
MKYKPDKAAVALEYGKQSAPTLTAKGQGDVAEAIIAEAQKQGVHIAEDPRLVALLSQLEIDDAIPEDLYVAVAVILSWVYWLQGMTPEDLD